MKKSIITVTLILFAITQTFAHYLWIETDPNGVINKEQEVKVYFGEYTYGLIEKVNGESFPKVKDFTLWIIDQNGIKTKLEVTPKENYYLAKFTPKTNGVYTIVLNNDAIDVIDYTRYDFGIFKTHYNSTAKIQVGNTATETAVYNEHGIAIKDISNNSKEIKLQVFYKNKPLAKNELKVFVADLWSKTLETDDQGIVTFKCPWKTKYIVETTFSEKVPGVYKGEKYEFTWHCATYSIL